jgi:hypothetical protein
MKSWKLLDHKRFRIILDLDLCVLSLVQTANAAFFGIVDYSSGDDLSGTLVFNPFSTLQFSCSRVMVRIV